MIDTIAISKFIAELLAEPTSQPAVHALKIIQSIINAYQDSADTDHLINCLRFIESIQIEKPRLRPTKPTTLTLGRSLSGLFGLENKESDELNKSSDDMRSYLSKTSLHMVTSNSQNNDIRNAFNFHGILPKQYESSLGRIYTTISFALTNAKKSWQYSFPKNERGEISNDVIDEWKKDMTTTSNEPGASTLAYRDFSRDMRFMDRDPGVLKTNDAIQAAIDRFVDDSTYSHAEKAAIKRWMAAHGGQAMNFYITKMVDEQKAFFVPDSLLSDAETIQSSGLDTILSMRIEGKIKNWFYDHNGKIIYHQDCQIKSILNAMTNTGLVICPDNTAQVLSSFSDEFETAAHATSAKHLASIESMVRLDLNEQHQVTPNVISFIVTSHTVLLRAPHTSDAALAASPETTAAHPLRRGSAPV